MIPSCLWLGCWWVGCRWLWCLHWHSTKLFVCEELDTLSRPNCSSSIGTSGWTLATYSDSNGSYDALEVLSGCGCPCAHQATIFLSLTDCPRPLVGTLLQAFALDSNWHTVLVSFKYSMELCLEVRVDQDTTLAHLPGPHCGLTVH